MDDKEEKVLLELENKASSILSEFMLRITKFEELVSVGSKFLVGFHEAVGFLQRSALHKTSDVADGIIKANETKRLKAYVQAACINGHDGVRNISKSNGLLNELHCFIDDMVSLLRTPNVIMSDVSNHSGDGLVLQGTSFEKEATELQSLRKPEVIDCASIMGTIYSMVKQDYIMQEKVISSLCLKSSSAELESYCLMWSLRPFINDYIMNQRTALHVDVYLRFKHLMHSENQDLTMRLLDSL